MLKTPPGATLRCMTHAETLVTGMESEEIRVYLWRLGRLERSGYSNEAADELAASAIDLHELEALLAAGCPRETAQAILL